MNTKILTQPVQKFIKDYKGNIAKLAFAGSPFPDISVQELIQQIEGREKAKKKLDYLLEVENSYFPPKLNLEQTSSEQTAIYKASLIKLGTIADLTGGFGIDTYHFSKIASSVSYFELNESLCAIAQHNFTQLNAQNISVANKSGLSIFEDAKKFATIYIDPSRRTESKQKVFFLNDCEPNVPELSTSLLSKCDLLLIKTSPMLDIQVGLQELEGVFEIHVVAINNEVKELLWLCSVDNQAPVKIKTINLKAATNETFNFNLDVITETNYHLPQEYLYEPNAAILKAGGFSHISQQLQIAKLHKHSHLFTSEILIDFPGRRFKIEQVVPYSKKEMKANISGLKANVTTRNFPETVKQLRKKWKLKDGGTSYLFFTSLIDNTKVVIRCSKISS